MVGVEPRPRFGVSYGALVAGTAPVDGLAAQVFRLLGTVAAPEVGVALVAARLGAGADAAEAALDRLVEVRLLEVAGVGRYRIDPLLRLYATELGRAERLGTDRPHPERRCVAL